MTRRSPFVLALGALLGTSAMIFPLAADANPAAATVPDASAIKPAAPTSTGTAPTGTAKATDAAPTNDASATNDTEAKRRAQRRADREAYFSAHVAAMHAGLALQPDQESLWQPVESAIRDLAKARTERWQMHHEENSGQVGASSDKGANDAKRSDSVDKLLARGENMTRMGNAIQTLAKATSPLLASLTTDQKDRLPTLVEGLKPRRLIASAFNLDDGAMEDGHRRGARDETDQGFGLRYQGEGRGDFMRGGPDRGDQSRYGMDGGSSRQGRRGQSGALGDQQRFMPGDAGDDNGQD